MCRVLRTEADKVKRNAKRADFTAWSETFYREHRDHVRGAVFPVAEALAATAKALGVELDAPAIAKSIADRHVDESRMALGSGMSADELTAAAKALESRGDSQATAEITRIIETFLPGNRP